MVHQVYKGSTGELHAATKDLVSFWKTQIKAAFASEPPAPVKEHKKEVKKSNGGKTDKGKKSAKNGKVVAPVQNEEEVKGKIRENTRGVINAAISDPKLSEDIEKEINDLYNGKLEIDYKNKVRSITMNLRRNEELRERLKRGEVLPKDLVAMDPREMATKEVKEHREKVEKEAFEARLSDWMDTNIKKNLSGMHKCGKCKGNKTTYYQQQTRSADEPMTTFVRCLDCGNSWKY
eukprot:TRINITY_DN4060_c0_g1_i17.p1 TRINITY_DN4060_c0_g1~~TRINITY_DN4060_c0_g1_i17.p1  ORF type:complete len:234 (-),score=76.82 TRINITY_DN4060_c0_g1_i17:92-793(-)